jgi:hypothetical protein
MIGHDLQEEFAYETAFWMAGVYSPEVPANQLGEMAAEVSVKLRAIAAFHLLRPGKTNSFYHNLIRSGMVRRQYLRRVLDAGLLEDHFRGSGHYLPFCDAIVAGDFPLVENIVDLSPAEFLAGHEYEDDYCYAQVLHGLATGRNQRGPELLARFERYLEGETSARYSVAKALLERDQSAFDAAFPELLATREREIAADIKRGQIESAHIVAFRRLFIEGLAVLRLAERAGLTTEDEYLFCPSLARVPMTEPFPGE